jgi:hypothetical protein
VEKGSWSNNAGSAHPTHWGLFRLRRTLGLGACCGLKVRKRQGLHSRTDLFRKSLHAYLASVGENDVAALLTDATVTAPHASDATPEAERLPLAG